MICYTAPANPVCQGGSVYFGCAVNGNAPQKIEMIPDGYRSGEPSCAEWAKMVVDQIRVVRQVLDCRRQGGRTDEWTCGTERSGKRQILFLHYERKRNLWLAPDAGGVSGQGSPVYLRE